MARKARGGDLLDQAKGYLSKAKTAEELRQVQAVVMPLEYGLSMEQTARAIGVSVSAGESVPPLSGERCPPEAEEVADEAQISSDESCAAGWSHVMSECE